MRRSAAHFLASRLGAFLLSSAGALAACGSPSPYYGLTLRVSGDHNGWDKDDQAATLTWNSQLAIYSGVVELPGDEVDLRLFAPRVGLFVGAIGERPPEFAVPATGETVVGQSVYPLRISTPLAARYQLDFDPMSKSLHIDLAADAERDVEAAGQALGQGEAALLIKALRGSDRISDAERTQRTMTLMTALRERQSETPIKSSVGVYQSVTLLHQGNPLESVSVVSDLNEWTPGRDPVHNSLGGQLAYLSRRTHGTRFEYRFDRDGLRGPDPLNLEIAWNGTALPPNPANLLGGNLGEFNSVAFAPGYIEAGPRLRRLPVTPGPLGTGEIIVYLPPGYDQQPSAQFPTLYVHDGKDAIVRGQYDRTLYVLDQQGLAPPVVGVFLSAPANPTERLAALAHVSDPRYPDVTPQGEAFGRYLLDTVVPTVERAYRVKGPRAMLGVDMAGPFSFYLAWTDSKTRFTRVASQSGRFDWGGPVPTGNPYFLAITADPWRVGDAKWRVASDWSYNDYFQARSNDELQAHLDPFRVAGNGYFDKQGDQYTAPWANLRARASSTIAFLFRDLLKK